MAIVGPGGLPVTSHAPRSSAFSHSPDTHSVLRPLSPLAEAKRVAYNNLHSNQRPTGLGWTSPKRFSPTNACICWRGFLRTFTSRPITKPRAGCKSCCGHQRGAGGPCVPRLVPGRERAPPHPAGAARCPLLPSLQGIGQAKGKARGGSRCAYLVARIIFFRAVCSFCSMCCLARCSPTALAGNSVSQV